MNSFYRSAWWKAKVPEDWKVSEDDVCVTFKSPGTSGTLQVSAAMKETAPVTDADLKEFADQRIVDRRVKPIKTTKLDGIHVEYIDDGSFWREWWLKSGNLMLYVTYSIQRTLKDAERPVIDEFIYSLESLDPSKGSDPQVS